MMNNDRSIIGTAFDMPHAALPVNLNLCAARGIFPLSKPD